MPPATAAVVVPESTHAVPPPAAALVTKADKERQLKIVARSVCKELKQQGYQPKEIINLATEILALVTADIAHDVDCVDE